MKHLMVSNHVHIHPQHQWSLKFAAKLLALFFWKKILVKNVRNKKSIIFTSFNSNRALNLLTAPDSKKKILKKAAKPIRSNAHKPISLLTDPDSIRTKTFHSFVPTNGSECGNKASSTRAAVNPSPWGLVHIHCRRAAHQLRAAGLLLAGLGTLTQTPRKTSDRKIDILYYTDSCPPSLHFQS